MASGKQLMEQIYDQFLVCKICFEIYKRPKTLICLHTFCVDCLLKHQDAEFERTYRYSVYNATLSCPICRKKTDLPTGGVRRLPDNFLVANLADVVTRRRPNAQAQECEICKIDGYNNHRQAVSKCLDCVKLLCRVCVELHMKTKVTKAHSLFAIESEKEIECKRHPDEIVRFYCEPCEQCICVVCTFQEHKGHDVSSFNEGMQKYQASLDKLVTLCRERIMHVKEQIGAISRCEGEIKSAEDQIRDVAIESITDIRKKERQMVQCVYDVFGSEALAFLKEKQPLQESLETLQDTCNLTDVVTSRDKNVELLLLKDEIQQKISSLLERHVTQVPSTLSKQIKFVPGNIDFGRIHVDGQVCSLDGESDVDGSLPSICVKAGASGAATADAATAGGAVTGSVDCQTDAVMMVDQLCGNDVAPTSIADSEHKDTQTIGLIELKEQATSTIAAPVAKLRSRGVMTLPTSLRCVTQQLEKQTNTDKPTLSKRKTQTDRVATQEQAVATDNTTVKTTNRGQNTKRLKTTDAGVVTHRTETCVGETDTLGLVVFEDKGVITPLCYLQTSTAATMTDAVEIRDTAAVTSHSAPGAAVTSHSAPGAAVTSHNAATSAGAATAQNVSMIGRLKQSVAGIFTGAASASGGDDVTTVDEPDAKRARFDDVTTQTEVKLQDLDRLWELLERRLAMTTTATNTDVDVIVTRRVETQDTATETEPAEETSSRKTSADTTENSTTMHSNVFKRFHKGERSVEFSADVLTERIEDDHKQTIKVRHGATSGAGDVLTCISEAPARHDVHLDHVGSCAVDSAAINGLTNGHASSIDHSRAQSTNSVAQKHIELTDSWTTTNHIVFCSDQSSGTDVIESSNKKCGTPRAPEMKDKRTSTFIERRNVAIMKRPHYISRGVLTSQTATHERTTCTDPRPQLTDATSSTDAVVMTTTGCDAEKPSTEAKSTGTTVVTTESSYSCTERVECIQRGSSPIRLPLMTNRECSPIKLAVCTKSTMASPPSQDRCVETLPIPSRDSFTVMPTVKHVSRKTSPVREFKPSVNQSAGTRHIVCESRASSPVHGMDRTRGTMTSPTQHVTRGSSPVRFRGKDKKILVRPEMTSVDVSTLPVAACDVGVATLSVETANASAETVRQHFAEKQTLTSQPLTINQMVGTETTRCVDGFTSMTADVASAYKESILPKPVRTCSRGTRTRSVKCVSKETSPHKPYTQDRACSPVQFPDDDSAYHEDSAPAANTQTKESRDSQAKEPRDLFQSVGMITMPFRPVADHPKSQLESIQELAEPEDGGGGGGRRGLMLQLGRRAISETDLETRSNKGQVLVYKEDLLALQRELQCKGAGTPPVETEDKCVCTESLQLGSDKMAACITKLKTVKQRLEHQPVYVQAPTSAAGGTMHHSDICQPTATLPATTSALSRSENGACLQSKPEAVCGDSKPVIEPTESNSTQSSSTGNSSTGSNSTGSNLTGSSCTVSHCAGSNPTGSTSTKSKSAGSSSTKCKTAGSSSTKSNSTGSSSTKSSSTGSNSTGSSSTESSFTVNSSIGSSSTGSRSTVERKQEVLSKPVVTSPAAKPVVEYPKALCTSEVDTSLTIRSKSIERLEKERKRIERQEEKKLMEKKEKESNRKCANLVSPELSKRINQSERARSNSRDDVMKRGGGGGGGALARKKRLLMDQLLGRSASLPEQDTVPAAATTSAPVMERQSLSNLSAAKPSPSPSPSRLSTDRLLRYLGKSQSQDAAPKPPPSAAQRNGRDAQNTKKPAAKTAALKPTNDIVTCEQTTDVMSRSSSSASLASSVSTCSTATSVDTLGSDKPLTSASGGGCAAMKSRKGRMMVETAKRETSRAETSRSSEKLFLGAGFKPAVVKEMRVVAGRYSVGGRGRSLIKSDKTAAKTTEII